MIVSNPAFFIRAIEMESGREFRSAIYDANGRGGVPTGTVKHVLISDHL